MLFDFVWLEKSRGQQESKGFCYVNLSKLIKGVFIKATKSISWNWLYVVVLSKGLFKLIVNAQMQVNVMLVNVNPEVVFNTSVSSS